jgi:ATP-dependent DNA helicase RecG
MVYKLKLTDKIQYLKGIGPAKAKKFMEFGVFSLQDMIRLFPRRHIDVSSLNTIREAGENDLVTIAGNITRVISRKTFGKGEKVEAFVHDGTGGVTMVWFNAPYMKEKLLKCGSGVFSGKITLFQGKKQMVNPMGQFDGESGTTAGGILPIYPTISDLSQNQLRVLIRSCLDECADDITDYLEPYLKELGIIPLKEAYQKIHFPATDQEFEEAKNRFVLEEFLIFQLAILTYKKEVGDSRKGVTIKVDPVLDVRIRNRFPFELTEAQNGVIKDIRNDLENNLRVNRLVQGDVGSGKTAIAIYFLLALVANKFQGALVAPTEVLAMQHYLYLKKILDGSKVRIGFFAGSQKKAFRDAEWEAAQSGESNIVVGTHAVFSDKVVFRRLGGVVIDEQHRFGVLQRAKLIEKGEDPHVIVMTATPIPRTLSLTIYGDLDTSSINALPPGRSPIRTLLINESQRKRAYATILKELEEGHQAYIVCPLIEESEELDYQSAVALYDQIKQEVFGLHLVGLLHGKLGTDEKQLIMDEFRAGNIKVLVCTQVIEVGVDCPNATIIMIDSAERFGLAQLHQLRGRVGRGKAPSTCLLLSTKRSGPSFERLKILEETNDGFKIAEADLEIRGTGEYFGLRQSGIPEFKIGHPLHDIAQMIKARNFASLLMTKNNYLVENAELQKLVEREYRDRLQLGGIS